MSLQQEILKSDVFQNIMRIVIACDRSKDFILDENELEVLIVRMGMISGVIFDEELFRREFNSDVSLKAIIILVRGLIDDEDTSAVGSIFRLEPRYLTQ